MDIYHFGWSNDELAAYIKQYQSIYYGSINDAQFDITDDEGNVYYAIFRSPAEDEWFVRKSKDYLLFKDQNRILLNIGGKLYRFLIKERKILTDACHDGVICNEFGKPNSPYFHSLTSPERELMVVVDCEGIAAINWQEVLWKQNFEWSDCGHLELLSINGSYVTAKYENCCEGKVYSISFNLCNGQYEMKKFCRKNILS